VGPVKNGFGSHKKSRRAGGTRRLQTRKGEGENFSDMRGVKKEPSTTLVVVLGLGGCGGAKMVKKKKISVVQKKKSFSLRNP